MPLHLLREGVADLADVLRLHILFKYEVSKLSAGHALQQPAGLVVLRHPPLLLDLGNCGSAYLQNGFESCPSINICTYMSGDRVQCEALHANVSRRKLPECLKGMLSSNASKAADVDTSVGSRFTFSGGWG